MRYRGKRHCPHPVSVLTNSAFPQCICPHPSGVRQTAPCRDHLGVSQADRVSFGDRLWLLRINPIGNASSNIRHPKQFGGVCDRSRTALRRVCLCVWIKMTSRAQVLYTSPHILKTKSPKSSIPLALICILRNLKKRYRPSRMMMFTHSVSSHRSEKFAASFKPHVTVWLLYLWDSFSCK